MIDFIFFVKMLLLTLVIVLLLQIKFDEHTVEAHAMGWVQSASITQPLNMVAHGAAKATRDLSQKIYNSIHHNVGRKHKKDEVHDREPASFLWKHSVQQASSTENEDPD